MRVVLAALLALAAQDDGDAVRSWVRDLASPLPETRLSASRNLLRAGRFAWPALEEARGSPDLDVSRSAEHLLAASRLRRGIPYSILRLHPDAPLLLRGPACPAKIQLIRLLGRHFDECAHLVEPLLSDADAETQIAAAEVLSDHRRPGWIEPLLELIAREDCPRAPRVAELLLSVASSLPRSRLEELFQGAGPLGRVRLAELATAGRLALDFSRSTLYSMLRDGARSARASLAWIRMRVQPEDTTHVEPLLESEEADVVVETLATLRAAGSIRNSSVRPLLEHEAPIVRSEALETLEAVGDPSVEDAALRLLVDPSTAVRRSAITVLWKRRGAGALEITLALYLSQDGDPRELAATYLLRCRGWVRPRLLEHLESRDSDRRLRSLELLYRMEGVSVLLAAGRDEEEEIRRWALFRLLPQEGSSILSLLENLAGDPKESIRFEALRGLVRRGKIERIEDLARFLSHREYDLALGAAETLLDFGGPQTPELARRVLRHDDAHLRRLALESLMERRTFDAVSEAIDCLDCPDPRLQRLAIQYLTQALAAYRSPEIVRSVRERLPLIAPEAAEAALFLVASTGDVESLRALRLALREGRLLSPDRALRELFDREASAGNFVGLLGDDPVLNDRVLRLAASREISDKEISVRLRELTHHRDPEVRASVVRGAADPRRHGLDDLILGALEDEEAGVRYVAVVAVADRSFATIPPRLERLLDDEDPEVRIASASALLRLDPHQRGAIERAVAQEEYAWVRRRLEGLLKERR